MHTHRVDVRVKNPENNGVLIEADHKFFGLGGGLSGSERCVKYITEFLKKARIFADESTSEHPTTITLDFKEIKIATRVDNQRPLTVDTVSGVALMFLRPDEEKDEGLLFKICPHNGVRLVDLAHFKREVSSFNINVPISEMAAETEAEKAVA